jgi:hypothetical protein
MKTNELIDLLVKDLRPLPSFAYVLLVATVCGTSIAAMAFATMIGTRIDIDVALSNEWFIYKLLITLSLVATTAIILDRTGRPDVLVGGRKWWLSLPLVLALAGAIAEMCITTTDAWIARAIGRNGLKCLVLIPFLSVAPLGCLLHGFRLAAPNHPGMAGSAAGLMAGAIAASLYALHCDDDSPLFILIWYTPAIAFVVLIGYLLGTRLLRW